MKLFQATYLVLISLFTVGAGCGPNSDASVAKCTADFRLAVVQVWDSTPQNDPRMERHNRATNTLRELLSRCALPPDGILIIDDLVVHPIELLLLAELYDDVRVELADIKSLNKKNRASLLLAAARYGNVEILRAIVDAGIEASLTDDIGNNALSEIVGARTGAKEKVAYLFELGVDPTVKNNAGLSALDAAVLAADTEIANQLLMLIDPTDERVVDAVKNALELAKRTESPLEAQLTEWIEEP